MLVGGAALILVVNVECEVWFSSSLICWGSHLEIFNVAAADLHTARALDEASRHQYTLALAPRWLPWLVVTLEGVPLLYVMLMQCWSSWQAALMIAAHKRGAWQL